MGPMLHTKAQGIGPLVPEKMISERFYHIWVWLSTWSCDPDAPNKLSFPRPMEAPQEIWLRLAQQFWRRRSLKMVDSRQWTDEGAYLYCKLINEPKSSGELKIQRIQTSKKKRCNYPCLFEYVQVNNNGHVVTVKNSSDLNPWPLDL